jgi:hypothetical protein
MTYKEQNPEMRREMEEQEKGESSGHQNRPGEKEGGFG